MNLADKTVLITGSTDGVGKLVAQRLAQAGAHVLLHGRSREKGQRTLADIRAATGSDRLEFHLADLASLNEVRGLTDMVSARHERLDLLINNAGIGFGPRDAMRRETSRDGYELRFAVNYLSGFLLTQLLLPTLQGSAPARIVNVSSAGQYPIDFDDVMLVRGYEGTRAYRQSKLAQVMFTFDLAERLEGSGVTVNCLHPATFMNTNMVIESGYAPVTKVEDGADAILALATSADLEGRSGLYFDGKREARANAQAYEAAARRHLWDLSLRLTGLAKESSVAAAGQPPRGH
ncbi:MAG TPA: SDR family NAD(P)-dependent oxidoreductase [Candidatus Angelobacter sp.]|nr:SDR family NAD(P)-dependent oxidoreductase [Candidatus Angelobacter sp.]